MGVTNAIEPGTLLHKPAAATKSKHVVVRLKPESHLWRVHGVDYDLTSFMGRHPGGQIALGCCRGTDCTNLFEQYHVMSERHRAVLAGFAADAGQLGAPAGAPRAAAAQPPALREEAQSAFHRDIKQMLREHFGALGTDSHKAKFSHEAIIMVLLAMYLPAWAGWLAGDWRCLVAVPLIGWFLMSNGAHDGSHFAASRSPTVNDLHACLSSPLYYTSANWCQQHVVSHHGETNILGVDVDLHHHPKDRMHPHQVHPGARVLSGLKNVGWHTISMFVSTFILSVVQPGLLFVVPHIKIALGIKLDARKGTGAGVAMTALMATSVKSGFGAVSGRFVLTTALWLTSMFVLLYPYWAFGLGLKGFAFSLMPYMISSILFMVVTQVSHIQKETQSDEVLDNADFFKRQALTSLDYSESSEVWRFLTGGLNVQSIHHVCPGVHSSHYTDLYPKFRAICQKHGCCPSSASNIGAALWRHMVYVYNLGEDFEACFTPEM